MQQSSATQSLHLSFWGLRKIVACSHSSSQCLLVSTVFGTVSSLHPTSFLMIFTLVYVSGTHYNVMVILSTAESPQSSVTDATPDADYEVISSTPAPPANTSEPTYDVMN